MIKFVYLYNSNWIWIQSCSHDFQFWDQFGLGRIDLLGLHNPPNYEYLVIHRSNNRNFHFFSFRISRSMVFNSCVGLWHKIVKNKENEQITKLSYRDLQKHRQIRRRVLWFQCQWKYRLHRDNVNYHEYQLQIHRIAILERFSNKCSFNQLEGSIFKAIHDLKHVFENQPYRNDLIPI